jgi:hypothetical protein
VISATVPPLQASRVAILVAAIRASIRELAGSASASVRSRVKPSGSLICVIADAR